MMTVSRRPTAKIAALAALLLLPLGASSLERVGPVDPTNGFPRWYQDATGVTLDLCVPADAAEAALCALPDVPPQGFPETFPNNWVGEHFYWVGDADATTATVDALLVLALESTFAAEDPIPGDQIVFGRMRIRVDPLDNGLYRVYTPYGMREFNVTANEINQTWDIGFACAQGTFDCALASDIDLFLKPADAPGGNELAPITVGTRQYLADPAVPTVVTGSREGVNGQITLANGQTRNANIFLVERVSPNPAIVAETYLFSVAGRIFNGPIVADVKVDRASYARDAAGSQVDVYATGFPARASRIPGQPIVNPAFPTVAFYSLPCSGPEGGPYSAPAGTPVPLARYGNTYWAREVDGLLPIALCVEKTLTGETSTYEAVDPLGDQIFVTKAVYTPATRELVVEAASSDVEDSQLELGRFGALAQNVLFVDGVASVTLPEGQGAPPDEVHVFSNQNGMGTAQVTTRETATVAIPATGVTLTTSVPSPQVPGTAVTFTAQGVGSPDPYQYRFWQFVNGAWEIVQDYSLDSTWVLPASTPVGSYDIAVHVRTSDSVVADAQALATFVIADPPAAATGVTLTPNLASPQPPGTEVTFHAQGLGSSGYQYRFWLYTNGAWQEVQPYGTASNWTMPTSLPAGNYQVAVHVRTNSGTLVDAQAVVAFVVGEPEPIAPATGLTLTPNLQSPQAAGTPVRFDAAGVGGSGTYQYRFWMFRNGAWEEVQAYGVGSSWTMPGTTPPGTYEIAVHVRTDPSVLVDVQAVTTFEIN